MGQIGTKLGKITKDSGTRLGIANWTSKFNAVGNTVGKPAREPVGKTIGDAI